MNPENPTGALPARMTRVPVSPPRESPRRPSRSALDRAFLSAVYENFSEHGTAFLEDLRKKRPDCYLRAILLILPKETEKPASATDALGGEDLEALVAGAKARLRLYGGVRAETAELDGKQSAEAIPPVPEAG
jgi:hypothetical protein